MKIEIGSGFFTMLTIAFIVLKLTGHITWSWIWILSPLWIPWFIVSILFIFFAIMFIIFSMLKDWWDAE